MSVFKKYAGKRITSKHPKYAQARWWVYRRVKGHKPIHRSIPEARTREQAELAERSLIEQLFGKRYGLVDTKTTFAEFVDTKYASYVEEENENVYVKMLFVETLKAHFGPRVLSEITPQDCRDFRTLRRRTPTKNGTPRAAASVNKEMSTLSNIFSRAIEEKIIKEHPMIGKIKPLETPDPRKRDLTDEQRLALARSLASDPDLYDVALLGVNLPVRRGQIFAIRAEDVKFSQGVVVVARSKGKKPREVPLNPKAEAVLKRRIERFQTGKLFDYTPTKFQKHWMKALIAAGINRAPVKGQPRPTREENFHFHDLRHVFGSDLVNNDVSLYHVKELFDHSDMETSAIYATVRKEKLTDAVGHVQGIPMLESEGIN